MPHFSRVLENVKNKEYGISINDTQALADMPHYTNIKLPISHKFCGL